MARIERAVGWAFLVQLLLILVFGGIGAWHMNDAGLHTALLLGSMAWLALLRATVAASDSRWTNWQGSLQFATCWLAFPLFKAIRAHFITHTADAALLALDRRLWGGKSLPEHLLTWERPWLSELLSSGYFLFYFLVLIPAIAFSWRRKTSEARAFFLGLTGMYLLGFTGYVLVPAGGPYQAFPAVFPYPAHGGAITTFLTHLVSQGITGMDVFPSLHAGISVYVLGFFALGGYRRLALAIAPVVLALVPATLYLRYHYGIDVLCGLALAAMVLAFIQRFRHEVQA